MLPSNESYQHHFRAYDNLTTVSSAWGYICLTVLSVTFGITFLPVKRYDMGNGLFFQWIMSIAIATLAFIVHLSIGSPVIWPITVLSGVLSATGNVNSIMIVKRLGMGVGMLIWSMVSMVCGWAVYRFGWFGLQPEVPHHVEMNYIGVLFAALGTIFYVFIKPPDSMLNVVDVTVPPTEEVESQQTLESESLEREEDTQPLQGAPIVRSGIRSPIFQRCLGVGLAILSGLCYSVVFVPIIYTRENNAAASDRSIDYFGSFGLGMFLASTIYFVIYGLVTRNQPQIPSTSMILPALLSGTFSGTAQSCWLIANDALQASITYPIASSMPGAIATFIGTVFFGEVRGRRNYIFLVLALSCTVTGSILTGWSK